MAFYNPQDQEIGPLDGLNPAQASLRKALSRRIGFRTLPLQERISQNIRTSGLRTSGVSQIPRMQAESQREQSQVEADIALLNQAEQERQAREAQERQFSFMGEQARLDREGSRDLARTQARQRLQQGLLSGAFGLASSFLPKPKKKFIGTFGSKLGQDPISYDPFDR